MKALLKRKKKVEEKEEKRDIEEINTESELVEADAAVRTAEELVASLDSLYESDNQKWRKLKFTSGIIFGETLGDLVNAICERNPDAARKRMRRAGEGIIELALGTLLGATARENEAIRKGLFKK
ncbi:MAG: hypothetical protein DRP00_00445 [Candidatus Aenigmatarchaeota archaeon]|nr:MAG: hypothetical protein DRP00_00445 [Candidatus Aenigmarchaeota archaeon]